jgi:hypothetical protein
MNSTDRTNYINYLKAQVSRCRSYGLNYCPFYSEWGWGQHASKISERAKASVYREIPYFKSEINSEIYSKLTKTTDGYGNGTNTWNNLSSVTISIPSSGEQAASINTIADTNSSSMRNTQCYILKTSITLNNLQAGDQVSESVYRQLSNKPASGSIPFYNMVNINNSWFGISNHRYIVQSVNSGVYRLKNALTEKEVSGTSLVIEDTVWMDKTLPFANGTYTFDNNIRWEFNYQRVADSRTGSSSIAASGFSVKMIDPLQIRAYPNWEKASLFSSFASAYTYESTIESEVDYVNTAGQTLTCKYKKLPTGVTIKKLRAHFRPLSEAGSECFRLTVDPISPAYDLIEKEMLTIIKEALGGEPLFYNLVGDEAFVIRQDKISKKNGANPSYSGLKNLEFFGAVMKSKIQRYQKVFKGGANITASTRFVCWGDMFLPFGEGYQYWAESMNDATGANYLKNNIGSTTITPIIWVYDYMKSWVDKSKLMLQLTGPGGDIQNSIDFLKTNGIGYMACFATDGKDFGSAENQIQNEVNMAKNWTGINKASTNASSFKGYLYCGWRDELRCNNWNGLISQAYFGWATNNNADLPAYWKDIRAAADVNGQPVLKLLDEIRWPLVAPLVVNSILLR